MIDASLNTCAYSFSSGEEHSCSPAQLICRAYKEKTTYCNSTELDTPRAKATVCFTTGSKATKSMVNTSPDSAKTHALSAGSHPSVCSFQYLSSFEGMELLTGREHRTPNTEQKKPVEKNRHKPSR